MYGSDVSERAFVISDFLRSYMDDSDAGGPRPLVEYQQRYPGHEELIAREFEQISTSDSSDPVRTVGRYRLERQLGRGGQGVVYLATDTQLDRPVALKLLTGAGLDSPEIQARFRREAAVASRLDHPAICTVYEAGEVDATPFIAMRFVAGQSLAAWIGERRQDQGARAIPGRDEVCFLVGLFERLARALHLAHEAGVVHRDIKPGNIMIDPEGRPVLLDFGLAQQDQDGATILTRSGEVFGTPGYVAPEQLGAGKSGTDRRADVWALGVSLYEALTLRRPFRDPSREGLYRAILLRDPPDPRRCNPAIPRDLATVLEVALDKRPDRRYQTALALAEDLQAVLDDQPIAASAITRIGWTIRWARRRPAATTLAAVLAVVVPVSVYIAWWSPWAVLRYETERERLLEVAFMEYLEEGDSPLPAIEAYRRVLQHDPQSVEALGALALLYLHHVRAPKEAMELLVAKRDLVARSGALQQLLADTHRDLGDRETAAQQERSMRAPSTAADHFVLTQRQGMMRYFSRSVPDDQVMRSHAVTAFALKTRQRSPRYFFTSVVAAQHAGHGAEALAIGKAATSLWPDSFTAWFALAEALRGPLAYVDDGLKLSREERKTEAMRCWQRCQEIEPERRMVYAQMGFFLKGFDVHDALECYRRAEAIGPLSLPQQVWHAELLLIIGKYDAAIERIRVVRRAEPRNLTWRFVLARMHSTSGRIREAREMFAALVEQDLDEDRALRARLSLADIDLDLRRYADASAWVEAVLAMKRQLAAIPESKQRTVLAWLHHLLGILRFQAGDLDAAASAYQKALEARPDGVFAAELARIRLRQDRVDLARAELERAIGLPCAMRKGWAHLVYAKLLAKDDVDRARSVMRAALEQWPKARGPRLYASEFFQDLDPRLALEHAVEALRLAGEAADWRIYRRLAEASRAAGQHQDAARYARLTLERMCGADRFEFSLEQAREMVESYR